MSQMKENVLKIAFCTVFGNGQLKDLKWLNRKDFLGTFSENQIAFFEKKIFFFKKK